MKVLLVTPPFTQLNTPYPATAYLKGFLNTLDVQSFQVDLGLEVILALFTKESLSKIFYSIADQEVELTDRSYRVFVSRQRYIHTIDKVISFLKNQNPTLAYSICADGFLPRAGRFDELDDMEWAFGSMGIQDKARYLSTLYLEDLGDFIQDQVDGHFGFSRYAERLARTASSFETLYESVINQNTFITDLMLGLLSKYYEDYQPDLVCFTAPFPGNVFGAFKCAHHLKIINPALKIVLGGGYANTELRSIYDERVFEFMDFITLDDGEAPLKVLLSYLNNEVAISELKRTFVLDQKMVKYINGSKLLDIPQREVGTPDYRDLKIHDYLSVIEVANPMHRLWSDGRWNKLTLAHGCYWGKCTFCDVSLDYIKRYEPVSAAMICDRIEEIIEQTGQYGFHFVDEAAPPALMRDVAMEIIERNLTVVWWTNIRFEKRFTPALCRLLRASGCIAVSGGLEVASDRLLDKMKKGVTVAQVTRVANAFTQANIMVHAYLMYGFPTQTAQETIDSLEVVRQLFQNNVLQSGFWHQFAMTAHSPVGLAPQDYGVVHTGPKFDGFAENDYFHDDPDGADHQLYSDGLKLSLFNYMQGAGLDESLDIWFECPTPPSSHPSDMIVSFLVENIPVAYRNNDKVVWLGGDLIEVTELKRKKSTPKSKKQPTHQLADEEDLDFSQLTFAGNDGIYSLYLPDVYVDFMIQMTENFSLSRDDHNNQNSYDFFQLRSLFEETTERDFDPFLTSDYFQSLLERGLAIV